MVVECEASHVHSSQIFGPGQDLKKQFQKVITKNHVGESLATAGGSGPLGRLALEAKDRAMCRFTG